MNTASGKTSTTGTTSGQTSTISGQMSFARTMSDKTGSAMIITLD